MALKNEWLEAMRPEFSKPYYKELYRFIREEYKTHTVYPPADKIFHAFDVTPLNKVRVVIIGQDPYHGKGQANGMCFSVNEGVELPPSLQNIFREIKNEYGSYEPENGCLDRWAEQGVFLLNTVLTVREHEPNSHSAHGWEKFTDKVMNLHSHAVAYASYGNGIFDRRAFCLYPLGPEQMILRSGRAHRDRS